MTASAGTVIFDNTGAAGTFGPGSGSQDGIAPTGFDANGDANVGPLYASFLSSSNSTGSVFDGLLLSLFAGDNTDGGSISVNLYADAGGAPGALIANVGTILDSSLADCVGDATNKACDNPGAATLASLTPSIALGTSTEYWIGLSTTGSGMWDFEGGDAGIGVAGQCFDNSTLNGNGACAFGNPENSYPNSYGAQVMQVTALDNPPPPPPSGAPEPASFIMFGTGVLAVGLYRRRAARS